MQSAMEFWVVHVVCVAFILIVVDQKQAFGRITNLDVPNYMKQGQTEMMRCTFDDDIANVLSIHWYRSADNITSRLDAFLMHSYNAISGTWTNNTEGRSFATIETENKISTLTIQTVNCKEDDQKYWCFIQVFGDAFQETASTDVCNCPTLTLKIKKEEEPIPDVARNNSIELLSGDSVVFESKADGYKPDTQNLITWTLGETEKSASLGSPGPSGNDLCPDLLEVSSELSYSASVDDNKEMLCATAALPSCNCSEQFCVQLLITGPVRVSRETMIVIGVIGCVILAIMIPVVVCLIRYKLGYSCENCKPDDPEPTTTNVTCLLEDTHSQTKDKETKCINTEENKEDKKEEDTKDNKEEVAEDNKKDNKEEEKNEKA